MKKLLQAARLMEQGKKLMIHWILSM